MPTLRAALFFCIALDLSFLTGCTEGVARQVVAVVLAVQGEVFYQSGKPDSFSKVPSDAKPGVGSVLRTSDGSGLDIELLPGARLRLSGNSEFRIEELKLVKDGNETDGGTLDRVARIRLNQGKATLYFDRPDETTGQFTVITDRATVHARSDCLFQIQTDRTNTRVTCVRGEVYALPGNGQASVIKEGHLQEWPATHSKPISAVTDPRGQVEMAAALKAEQQLRELEPEERFRLR
jgi:hypothetical protein